MGEDPLARRRPEEMKLKDYCLICLLILTAVSGILYWTSTLEIVSVEAVGVDLVKKTKVVPTEPLEVRILHSYSNDEFIIGERQFTFTNTHEYAHDAKTTLLVNGSALLERISEWSPESTYFEFRIALRVEMLNGRIRDALCTFSWASARITIVGKSTVVMDHDEVWASGYLHLYNSSAIHEFEVTLVQYPSFLDETDIGEMEIATRVHFVVYFDIEATCWAEKPHEVEYDDFELCRVKVIRHLFGDGDIPTASKHQQNILVFSNTTTQNVFRHLFLILLTLNSINFLRRNQSNE